MTIFVICYFSYPISYLRSSVQSVPVPSPEKIEPPTLYFYPFTVSASAAGAFGGTWADGLVQREERGGGPPTRTEAHWADGRTEAKALDNSSGLRRTQF